MCQGIKEDLHPFVGVSEVRGSGTDDKMVLRHSEKVSANLLVARTKYFGVNSGEDWKMLPEGS